MTRFRVFGVLGLLAGAFLTGSAAQAETLYHPYCEISGDVRATDCTYLTVRYAQYDGYRHYHDKLSRVEAVIGQDCRVATNRGTVQIAASEEKHLVLPGSRKMPVTAYFVFPSGCAVKLHGKTGALKYWLNVQASQNVGNKVSVTVNMEDGEIYVSRPQ